MPPRYLKSELISILFVAWMLGKNPGTKFMVVSYGDDLARELTKLFRRLIKSDRYKDTFPHVQIDESSSSGNDIYLTSGGGRLGLSVGGAITGRGADVIIIDDPSKASDMRTKERGNVNDWFDENVYQRLDNKNTGVLILVMQRLHLNDLSGHLLDKHEEWRHLALKAVAESDESYELSDGRVLVRKSGEALHPAHESREGLDTVRLTMGDYLFSAQYQQSPQSDKNAVVRREDFLFYSNADKPSCFEVVVQSWDTASTDGTYSSYSAGMTIGKADDKYYLLSLDRLKAGYVDLKARMISFYERETHIRRVDLVLIEKASSGYGLGEELALKGYPVNMEQPKLDKRHRLEIASEFVRNGQVLLPQNTHYVDDFLDELTRFPDAQHDDQVDAFSQAFIYFKYLADGAWSQKRFNEAFPSPLGDSANARFYNSLLQNADPKWSGK